MLSYTLQRGISYHLCTGHCMTNVVSAAASGSCKASVGDEMDRLETQVIIIIIIITRGVARDTRHNHHAASTERIRVWE